MRMAPSRIPIPQDYHIHSRFSADSVAAPVEICHVAAAKGLPEIGFAEHYDLHPAEGFRDWFRVDAWNRELEACRMDFADRLVIRAGVEIGEPHLYPVEVQALLENDCFDYAMGSLHWVGSENVFDRSYFNRPAEEAFRLYFEELERMTRAGGFDILGHFDVLIRTGFQFTGPYDPLQYESYIRPVLHNCIEQGIALDINTGALRRRAKSLSPGIAILRWYVEMGGERVTLGSDAHRPDEVGSHLDLALEAVSAAGLRYLCCLEKRRVAMIPIP